MKFETEFVGRTFDDFLVKPAEGVAESRSLVTLNSRLTTLQDLSIPIVSSNMESVTEAGMAQAMALEGGIGIIHRAMPIEVQAKEVREVKRSHGFTIEQPLSLPRTATIAEARAFTRQHNITGILIEEERGSNILAGLLSNRDIPWHGGRDREKVEKFMTPFEHLVTQPPGVSADQAGRLMYENRIEKLPLVDSERRIAGLITKKDLILFRQRPYFSRDVKGRLLVGAAIGARGDFLERAAELIQAGVDVLVIDVAHGHSRVMRQAMESFRRAFDAHPLICGNVGTAEGCLFLKELGANAIKVGIGPGRGCRTRLETAAGVPQLQAIREAWCAVGESIPIIADGGIAADKDVFLALMVGASSVMLGSMLSGTEEAPGRIIVDPSTHEKRKIYRGMTSPQAVLEALYEADHLEDQERAPSAPPEGQEMQVPYKGSVVDILHRICGHLRSAVSYSGGQSLSETRIRIVHEPLKHLIPLSEAAQKESFVR